MAKKFFQDVVPPGKRSIRNIPVMGGRMRKKKMPPEDAFREEENYDENTDENIVLKQDYSVPTFVKPEKSGSRAKIFLLLAILLVGGFIFSMMTVFTSAKVDIVPKKEPVSFNLSVPAKKSILPGESALRFEIVEVNKSESVEVEAEGEEMAEKRASGTIIVYNDFSEESQRLIARTRFETTPGLVYRISESIIVPGKSASGPGSVEAVVYADEAGEKYNIKKGEFTLPGFRSDPERYKAFTAKSKTAFTGGFVGKVKKVSAEDRQAAIDGLKTKLSTDLLKEAEAKIPEGFAIVKGAAVYNFEDKGVVEASGSKAILNIEGSAKIVALDKHSLSQVVANEYVPEWKALPTEIRNLDDVAISFDPAANLKADTIPLKLIGTADLYTSINGVLIVDKLKGMPKSKLNEIMSGLPAVSSAKASIRPIWRTSFPGNGAKIQVNIE